MNLIAESSIILRNSTVGKFIKIFSKKLCLPANVKYVDVVLCCVAAMKEVLDTYLEENPWAEDY